jgi:hypothetical protein
MERETRGRHVMFDYVWPVNIIMSIYYDVVTYESGVPMWRKVGYKINSLPTP